MVPLAQVPCKAKVRHDVVPLESEFDRLLRDLKEHAEMAVRIDEPDPAVQAVRRVWLNRMALTRGTMVRVCTKGDALYVWLENSEGKTLK